MAHSATRCQEALAGAYCLRHYLYPWTEPGKWDWDTANPTTRVNNIQPIEPLDPNHKARGLCLCLGWGQAVRSCVRKKAASRHNHTAAASFHPPSFGPTEAGWFWQYTGGWRLFRSQIGPRQPVSMIMMLLPDPHFPAMEQGKSSDPR